ncbi:MAG: L-arabinose isomerase [Bilifractor sp.]|jgi:L-arabinose isomerase|nr:L-arabinose isomerase [Lachnospiraceae bacterium]
MVLQRDYKFWFCPGSVDLYSDKEVQIVTEHVQKMVAALNASDDIPYEIVQKPTLLTSTDICQVFNDANNDPGCAGVIAWMHMFSPAKSWLRGLKELRKPLLHLATQFNEEIPYDTLNMDFININQSAHGDREFAYMLARMHKTHKTVFGYWQDPDVRQGIGRWMRTAVGVIESQSLRIVRFTDNMLNVADTEGDKIDAQIRIGWQCDYHPMAELEKCIDDVTPEEIRALTDEYYATYKIMLNGRDPQEFREHVEKQAAIEIGTERYLVENNYQVVVDHFGDLGGLKQLPGLAMQRLMAKGYGFGPEGDWKTPALFRVEALMCAGMKDARGMSFFEDYTYNLVPGQEGVLETHMLEVCPLIADGQGVGIRVEPLSLGGLEDPARLVFTAKEGKAVAASLVDMGDNFRLVINDVNVKKTVRPMPNLPLGTAFWTPEPDFRTGVEAWLMAGGCHHNVMTYDLDADQLADWADMVGIESVIIDKNTNLRALKKQLGQ